MESKNEKLAVSVRTAAEMISVSPRTVENYIRAKILPSRKVGKRRLITVRALQNFLRSDQPSPGLEVARADQDR
jgi:excisionase family DNA binding protein